MKKTILLGLVFLVTCFCRLTLSAQSSSALQQMCTSVPPIIYNPSAQGVQDGNIRNTNAYQLPFDTIKYDTILGNNAFNLLICFDGVTNTTQAAKADRYVDSFITSLQKLDHYRDRYNYFNIFRLCKFSNEEGASWGYAGDTSVDNRYGTRFNAFGLSRLIVPDKYDTLIADMQQYVPDADLVLILVFDKKYGGSGWRNDANTFKTAMFTLDEESGWHLGDETALHEMQHLMEFDGHGYPGDEYEDSASCAIYVTIPPSPNVTADTINDRKWQHCMGIPGVGFYPHAGICPGNYKPTNTCLMQTLLGLPQLCPVCRENSTAWFDSLIHPIYFHSPDPANYSGSYTFRVRVETPVVNTFQYRWLFDDSTVALNTDSLLLHFDLMDKSHNHTLRFVCTDTDTHIVDTTLRRPWSVSWNLLTDTSATGITTLQNKEYSLSPNPVRHILQLKCPTDRQDNQIRIFNTAGMIVHEFIDLTKASTLSIDVADLPSGIYILKVGNTSTVFSQKFIKR